MTKKTFKQIYEELDPTPPKMRWIQRIAKATMRSELTVRMWLNGRQSCLSGHPSQPSQTVGVLGFP